MIDVPITGKTDPDMCENTSKDHNCTAPAMPGHIYCAGCYVATGGYYKPNVTLGYVWRAKPQVKNEISNSN